MWSGRHCREDEGSKVEMVWTRDKKRLRRAGQGHYGMEYNGLFSHIRDKLYKLYASKNELYQTNCTLRKMSYTTFSLLCMS